MFKKKSETEILATIEARAEQLAAAVVEAEAALTAAEADQERAEGEFSYGSTRGLHPVWAHVEEAKSRTEQARLLLRRAIADRKAHQDRRERPDHAKLVTRLDAARRDADPRTVLEDAAEDVKAIVSAWQVIDGERIPRLAAKVRKQNAATLEIARLAGELGIAEGFYLPPTVTEGRIQSMVQAEIGKAARAAGRTADSLAAAEWLQPIYPASEDA